MDKFGHTWMLRGNKETHVDTTGFNLAHSLPKLTHRPSLLHLPWFLCQVWVIMWQIMNLLGVLGVGVALGNVSFLFFIFSKYSLALILANPDDLESI